MDSIDKTLGFLSEKPNTNISELKNFYQDSKKTINGQPPQLRNLRFCVPAYLTKISHEDFEVQGLNAWYYKTFYHAAFNFELRQGKNILGLWPPLDEIKKLLRMPLKSVKEIGDEIVTTELAAPMI